MKPMKRSKVTFNANTVHHRRGKRKSQKSMVKTLRFLGVNSAGLRSKMTTFQKIISELKPSVFMVEEYVGRDYHHVYEKTHYDFQGVQQPHCQDVLTFWETF